jgi:hypothetical protein
MQPDAEIQYGEEQSVAPIEDEWGSLGDATTKEDKSPIS